VVWVRNSNRASIVLSAANSEVPENWNLTARFLIGRVALGSGIHDWVCVVLDGLDGLPNLALHVLAALLELAMAEPVERANSGSLFAPNSRTATSRMIVISKPPGTGPNSGIGSMRRGGDRSISTSRASSNGQLRHVRTIAACASTNTF
jgi:hypothetical protein